MCVQLEYVVVNIKSLKQELGNLGWYMLREGKHEIWTNGSETMAIPRHKEINEFTAKIILRTASRFCIKKEKR